MQVIPAPCLMASSSISIGQAITKMQEADTSYILLFDEVGHISGIFTDRDVLKKFQMLASEGQLDHGIHTVMSRPVKTLPLRLMHTTPEYMKTHDIRHVPILASDNDDELENKVVGIITRRQIFSAYVAAKGMPLLYRGSSNSEKHRLIGVLSPDGTAFNLVKKLAEDSSQLGSQRYMFSDLHRDVDIQKAATDCDAIVIDIDNAREQLWSPVVKFFIENPKVENVCIIYTKENYPNLVNIMDKLESQGLLEVYEKPINIGRLILDLEQTWSEEND